jgi:hypothetical protein
VTYTDKAQTEKAGAEKAQAPSSFKRHAKGKMPIPQWAPWEEIDLSVAFAEKRSVGFVFDPFGRVTTYAWKGDARAATATGAIAGIATDLQGAISAGKYSEIDADIARVTREATYYEMQNKLKEQRELYFKSLESPAPASP